MGSVAPAQKYEVPSVVRGQSNDRAIALPEKGLPTQERADRIIAFSCLFEQPICKYVYLPRGRRATRNE